MAELVLHVQDIDETGKDYTFELTPAWLEATLRDASLRADPAYTSGRLDVHAQQNGTEYLVNGSVSAHLITECGRCLGDAKVEIEAQFATLFHRGTGKLHERKAHVHEHAHELDDLALDDDELQREEFVGHDIPLDELVREHIVLEVPMQPLCSESCQGIPVPEKVRPPEEVFGTKDERVDPRLAPLKRLRDKVPPNKD
ncbi:MAG TPA: DUF177 domain-containing protein [Polyangiales bacterium]|jgi:uncharacterized protein